MKVRSFFGVEVQGSGSGRGSGLFGHVFVVVLSGCSSGNRMNGLVGRYQQGDATSRPLCLGSGEPAAFMCTAHCTSGSMKPTR